MHPSGMRDIRIEYAYQYAGGSSRRLDISGIKTDEARTYIVNEQAFQSTIHKPEYQ